MSAYPNVKFLRSAHAPGQFEVDTGAEVAVAGRSNAGKSSAINSIVQRKALAKTSKTPGATRLVNFFELEANRRLVDLPGYGFAKVPGPMRQHWGRLMEAYFAGRRSLRGTIVVMDIRHPLTDYDREMLSLATAGGRPAHVLLTKSDKLGRGAASSTLAALRRNVGPGVTAQLFSALDGRGVIEARGALQRLLAGQSVGQKEAPVGSAEPTGEHNPALGGCPG
jgi:GTP-binding protein